MTADERMRAMTTAHVRRNYWLCEAQLEIARDDQPRLDQAAAQLQTWQAGYLDELVRRGVRT